jgi:SRSO17 transposase
MTLEQIAALGGKLVSFLRLFADCFGRRDARKLLHVYVKGQLSNLSRKSAEVIALRFGTAPRTLQRFLESIKWDEEQLRDRCQQLVARDHAHPKAIGCIDESGTAKTGSHTVGVQRQWNGNRGKIDNCVVGVHLSYAAPGFQVLLDSALYLPKEWADDPVRRRAHYVPDDIEFRTKQQIASSQIEHALDQGVRVSAWTFDELYGRDGKFLDRLESCRQMFVGEIPRDFHGWVQKPAILRRGPEKSRKQGRQRRYPRVARRRPSSEVSDLLTYSPVFREQSWQRYRIKDTDKGPEVWEVKWATFWRKNDAGLPTRRHTLIVTRHVLTGEVKYFLANRMPGERNPVTGETISLRDLLSVAFGRWPIENCFRQGKEELGLDHYQVRGWRCVHRHFYVTQLSHLFCARVRQQYDRSADDPAQRLTVEQVRSAVNVWLDSADLPPATRRKRYATEQDKQRYYQRRNEQARKSHRKTRLKRLAALGIDVDQIKSCRPPDESP